LHKQYQYFNTEKATLFCPRDLIVIINSFLIYST
jgi:hypothetical protein